MHNKDFTPLSVVVIDGIEIDAHVGEGNDAFGDEKNVTAPSNVIILNVERRRKQKIKKGKNQ
jgi:hypothetical protein